MKKIIHLLFVPDSWVNLSRTGMLLTSAYLLLIQFGGAIFLTSIFYKNIYIYPEVVGLDLINPFYFFWLFSFFYMTTSFAELGLQIILDKYFTLKQFYPFLNSLFIFLLCSAALMAINTYNNKHLIFSVCGCTHPVVINPDNIMH